MKNINWVIKKKLCSGCGACKVICPKQCIRIIEGANCNFPLVESGKCIDCRKCLDVCPGFDFFNRVIKKRSFINNRSRIVKCCISYSNNSDIRYNAASGGIVTGMASFLLGRKLIDGVICVKQSSKNPLFNEVFIAKNILELQQSMGSRYSPVSNCMLLKEVINSNGKYVFVGKPCEIQALSLLERYMPSIRNCIFMKIGLMCASSPLRDKVINLLRSLDVNESDVSKIAFRGNGWPGFFCVETNKNISLKVPYYNAWNNHLCKNSSVRCIMCDDPFAINSDITVGDAWDEKLLSESNEGFSAVIIRSDLGKMYFDLAVDSKEITSAEVSLSDIERFQSSLLNKSKSNSINLIAYDFVYNHKLYIKDLIKECGTDLKKYLALSKRILRFLGYKIRPIYR